ncbi:DNA-binding transcriptional repressor MarR [Mycobacterium basiliense]|uniref:DNA-binding transcriptional repressor MarR n=1 Tax=Mycobacterium basiliense TaxID=2094119 RepID=A0A3S4BZB9_9MYCO|nr:MarR family transcriptional regulator [Mycobacterium basiliense]VDM90612.1 DNA-binding transcriptional repressor MarR [Mycobacterium basiliense]
MTKRGAADRPPSRAELERLLSADLREITGHSDRVGRHYARQHDLTHGDFQALLHIMIAESAGQPLTPAQLSQRLDVSAAAITYFADRMIEAGHIRREPDPADRRKSLLCFENSTLDLAHEFFLPLGQHIQSAMADISDRDLLVAHRVFVAMITAMSTFENELYAPPEDASAPTENAAPATAGRRRRPAGKAKTTG